MDWNGDNKKDLLTGENNGNIRIFLNTNTDADPVFSGHTLLQVAGTNFDCGSYSAICISDWNEDGLFDILCGESGGRIYLLINTGTPGVPQFATKPFLQSFGTTLDVGSTCSPCVVDWNRDGKKDLLVGETYGNIFYFVNQGTNAVPVFNGSVKLSTYFSLVDVGYYARPNVDDWNEDGVADILCGSDGGNVLFFESEGPLALSENAISDGTGGISNLKLNAGAAHAGRTYLVLGSASGMEPGMALPGGHVTLPLNWDAFTDLGLTLLNSPVFLNFYGNLNNSGGASARFSIPAGTGYAGTLLHFAYVMNNPFDYVSNAAAIEIIP